MDYDIFVQALFDAGKKEGFESMEVYYQKDKSFDIMVFKGEVDKFTLSESAGLSFRGLYKGQMAYAYTERLDEEAVDMLVKEAKSNAEVLDVEDETFIGEANQSYPKLEAFEEKLNQVKQEEKINFLKSLEKKVISMDPRVQMMGYNLFTNMTSEVKIKNTKGLDLKQASNLALNYAMAIANDGQKSKTAHKLTMGRDFDIFDPVRISKVVVDKATSFLGAKSLPSKIYPVILENECAASLLAAFSSVFNAEIVHKDMSMMKDKLNQVVSSNVVTLVDDPFLEGGLGNISFDAEGTPAQKTYLIKEGVLNSYLHNLITSKKDGLTSTGNASKSSYKASMGISPSNLYIQRGTKDLESLASDIEEGIVIHSLEGLHSGLNTISGDFSLAASGFKIEKGKITEPVDQITVAGNLKNLFMDIEAVGNDLEFTMPHGHAFIASPSLKIKGLAVSGE